MFKCRACNHDDMVHRNFVGCCGHQGCPCTSMDSLPGPACTDHGSACWWAIPRKVTKPENFRVKMVQVGNGYRYILYVDGEHWKTFKRGIQAVNYVKNTYQVDIPRPEPKPIKQ